MKKIRNARAVILQQLNDNDQEIAWDNIHTGNVIRHSSRKHDKLHPCRKNRTRDEREKDDRSRIRF